MRVLIVEDELLIGMSIEAEVERAGHDVVGLVSSASAALDLLDREEAPVDVVMMDFDLSGDRTGVDAARDIRKLHDVRTIFLTGRAHDPSWRSQMDALSDGVVLPKPCRSRDMIDALEGAYRRTLQSEPVSLGA